MNLIEVAPTITHVNITTLSFTEFFKAYDTDCPIIYLDDEKIKYELKQDPSFLFLPYSRNIKIGSGLLVIAPNLNIVLTIDLIGVQLMHA